MLHLQLIGTEQEKKHARLRVSIYVDIMGTSLIHKSSTICIEYDLDKAVTFGPTHDLNYLEQKLRSLLMPVTAIHHPSHTGYGREMIKAMMVRLGDPNTSKMAHHHNNERHLMLQIMLQVSAVHSLYVGQFSHCEFSMQVHHQREPRSEQQLGHSLQELGLQDFPQQCIEHHLHPMLQNYSQVRTVKLSTVICCVTFGRVMVDAITEFKHKLLRVLTNHSVHVILIDNTGQPITAREDIEHTPIQENILQADLHLHECNTLPSKLPGAMNLKVSTAKLPHAVPVLKGDQWQAEHVDVLRQQPQTVKAPAGHQPKNKLLHLELLLCARQTQKVTRARQA